MQAVELKQEVATKSGLIYYEFFGLVRFTTDDYVVLVYSLKYL